MKIIKLICLVFFGAIIPLIISEIMARIVLEPPKVNFEIRPHKTSHENNSILSMLDKTGRHGVRLVPSQTTFIHNHEVSGQDATIYINSSGVRYPELGPKEDHKRILALGDSITFNDFLNEEQSWPNKLEQLLKTRGAYQVINAGIPGANLLDQYYHLLEIKDIIQADIVLEGLYLNDGSASYSGYVPLFHWWESALYYYLKIKLNNFSTSIPWNHQPPSFVSERLAEQDWGLGWNSYAWTNIQYFLQSMKRQGLPLFVVLFPIRQQVEGHISDISPQLTFQTVCTNIELKCLDLLPILQKYKNENLFFDVCHLTPRGNEIVARAISDWGVFNSIKSKGRL